MAWYKEKKYIIIYEYQSGYVEIQDAANKYKMELVHQSEIVIIPPIFSPI